MLTLFHHPFCPLSRFVRIALAEHGLDARLIEERVWERRRDFLLLNPAGTVPVLAAEGEPPIPGPGVICEFLDEAYGDNLNERRLMPLQVRERIEVRRLLSWFNDKFYAEATGPLVLERIYKRFMPESDGGGAPDAETLRAARVNVRNHLGYIGWLASTRDWLAGERMTYVDLAAAAHLSVIDYLGDVPWPENDAAKSWYVRIKSRPSFRPILADWLAGVPASPTYTDLDF